MGIYIFCVLLHSCLFVEWLLMELCNMFTRHVALIYLDTGGRQQHLNCHSTLWFCRLLCTFGSYHISWPLRTYAVTTTLLEGNSIINSNWLLLDLSSVEVTSKCYRPLHWLTCWFRYRMLSFADPSGTRTVWVSLRNCLYMLPLGLLAYNVGVTCI